jgi:hypothetical protein
MGNRLKAESVKGLQNQPHALANGGPPRITPDVKDFSVERAIALLGRLMSLTVFGGRP